MVEIIKLHRSEVNFVSTKLNRAYLSTYTEYPFWNIQIGTKRNMSYDLRGDIPIPMHYVGPWLNSPHIPIYNKPLYLVS